MEFETLRYEIQDGILTLTLNRPERMNAFNVTMADELIRAIDLADQDDAVRVIIVTGAGRAFCAGMDLEKGGDTFSYDGDDAEPDWQALRDRGGLVTLRFFNSLKPMIAAINGPAVGIGATMFLPMDIRLIADTAKVGFVFCRRGIVPDGAASWFLPHLVGVGQTLEWVMTGRVFPAAEALGGGLVRSVHTADDLMPAAVALAREIADNTSAVSVAVSRAMIWRMAGQTHPMYAHQAETRGIYWTGRSADAREGVMSFIEKRPPNFPLSPARDLPPDYPWWQDPEFS